MFVVGYLRLSRIHCHPIQDARNAKGRLLSSWIARTSLGHRSCGVVGIQYSRDWTTPLSDLPQSSRYFLKVFEIGAGFRRTDAIRPQTFMASSQAAWFLRHPPLLTLNAFRRRLWWVSLWLWRRSTGFMSTLALLAPAIRPLLLICASSAGRDAKQWVPSAIIANSQNSIDDLKTVFPHLKSHTTLYVLNDEAPDLWWHQASGVCSGCITGRTVQGLLFNES
jgi:hypothetical protein